MTNEPVSLKPAEICSNLGLAGDPAVRCLGASTFHRCYAGPDPRPISERDQEEFCLSGAYHQCERRQPESSASAVATVVSLFGGDPGVVRDAMGGAAEGALKVVLGLGWMVLAITALVLLAPILTASNNGSRTAAPPPTAVLAQAPLRQSSPAAVAPEITPEVAPTAPSVTSSPASGAGAAAKEVPTAAPSAVPTKVSAAAVSEVPKPTAAPAPKPAPTPVPAAAKPPASGSTTYVVQRKDTLWSLAKAYGVTVDEIMKANGLKDPNSIKAGQQLTIPAPASRP